MSAKLADFEPLVGTMEPPWKIPATPLCSSANEPLILRITFETCTLSQLGFPPQHNALLPVSADVTRGEVREEKRRRHTVAETVRRAQLETAFAELRECIPVPAARQCSAGGQHTKQLTKKGVVQAAIT
jgi:hypothetical protein